MDLIELGYESIAFYDLLSESRKFLNSVAVLGRKKIVMFENSRDTKVWRTA